ncbi:zinc finger protein 414 [Gouania willdenowi]|uniref:zinc finger protein 414 n=1 Tax=Gouania willdenowi TaxID=441366 RepID=UPI0010568DB9|nr:zinc finger protein 414 [Gouania willdenowi]
MTSPEANGTEKLTCSQYGCKRIYNDPEALEQHLQEHQIPAQSVPAKVLLCSSIGCSSSFPNMQKLMEHVRCHHKLNVFFQCESCRTKLRSYRGLLTHLHSCSKVGRGRPKAAEAPASTAPTLKEQPPAQLEVTSASQQGPTQEAEPVAFHLSPPLHLTDVSPPPFLMDEGPDPPPLT